ncbi:hypothetical protein [Nocardia xishanensis]|uniref:Uncharacterized protein n=1 Tax=Nocardia xishanensis TaxID=238964 RepID=A0ABW7WZI0_9NOCA
MLPADPDAAEDLVVSRLGEATYGLAMIGGGIEMLPEQTLLFEPIANVLTEAAPGIRLCFGTSRKQRRMHFCAGCSPPGAAN